MSYRTLVAISLLLAGLAACTVPAVPTNYIGPVAHVDDSWLAHPPFRGDFFYLSKVDGR